MAKRRTKTEAARDRLVAPLVAPPVWTAPPGVIETGFGESGYSPALPSKWWYAAAVAIVLALGASFYFTYTPAVVPTPTPAPVVHVAPPAVPVQPPIVVPPIVHPHHKPVVKHHYHQVVHHKPVHPHKTVHPRKFVYPPVPTVVPCDNSWHPERCD